jgi:hypothetical protein
MNLDILRGINKVELLDNNHNITFSKRYGATYDHRDPRPELLDRAKWPFYQRDLYRSIRLISGDSAVPNYQLWNEINQILIAPEQRPATAHSDVELWNDSIQYRRAEDIKNERADFVRYDYKLRFFKDTFIDRQVPRYLTTMRLAGMTSSVATSLPSITEDIFIKDMQDKNVMGALSGAISATQRENKAERPGEYKILVAGMWIDLGEHFGFEVEWDDDDDRIGRNIADVYGIPVNISVPRDLAMRQHQDHELSPVFISRTEDYMRYGVGLPQLAGFADPFKNAREYELYMRSITP